MKASTFPPRLLAALAVVSLFSACRREADVRADAQWWRLEADRVDLAHQVELLELKISKAGGETTDPATLEIQLEELAAHRADLKSRISQIEGSIGQVQASMDEIKMAWMRSVRNEAVGREFPRMAGTKGRVYQDVVIQRVTDAGVEFRHATGTARLIAADLSPSQQEMFGLDLATAEQAVNDERQMAQAYHQWVDASLEQAQKEQELKQARAAAAVTASRPVQVASAVPAAEPVSTRLRQDARSFGRRDTTWYSSYYYGSYRNLSCYRPVTFRPVGGYSSHSPTGVMTGQGLRFATPAWGVVVQPARCQPTIYTPRVPTSSIYTSPFAR